MKRRQGFGTSGLCAFLALLLTSSQAWGQAAQPPGQPPPEQRPGQSSKPSSPPAQRRDYRIIVRGHQFDPLKETLRLPPALRLAEVPARPSYHIVQFDGPLTRDMTATLKSDYRLRLSEYIPHYAFLELLSAEEVAALRQLPFFRWSGPYEPAFKLDPDIGKHRFITERRRAEPGILLMVVAFPEASLDDLAQQIRALGFQVVATTDEPKLGIRRLQARVNLPKDAERIARLPAVKYIEEVGEVTLNNNVTTWVNQSNVLNSRVVWTHQLQGENQIIGHIDNVIDLNNCFFQDNVDNTVRPDHRKVVGLRDASGTGFGDHGTFSAGNAAGEDFNADALAAAPNPNNGNAPRARLTNGNLSDLDLNAGGGTSVFSYLTEAAEDGAFIHTNSWDPKNTRNYTQVSADIDRFTWENEDHLVIFGPDNNGPIRPGTNAKNVLVVNATQQNPNQNNFSTGVTQFTLDGRRKPDVMAPGQNIVSADGGTACGTRTLSGTSFAAPSVAGLAALVRQYYTEGWYPSGTHQPHHRFTPSGNLLKATLANATVDATGIAGFPGVAGTGEGWGRVLLDNGLFFAGDARNLMVWDVRRDSGIFSGESRTHSFTVAAAGQPLRVTLVWSEPPAPANTATGAADAVGSLTINDLDLTVTAPDGVTTFRGNDINTATGASIANGGTADGLNVLEQVVLPNPAVGTFTITVSEGANTIAQGPQGYALVVTADLPEPPVPTGAQNILVVRAALSDKFAGSQASLTTVQNAMTNASNYFAEVSYGNVTLNPSYAAVTLPQPSTFYYHPSRNVLVEMTEDTVAELLAANPSTFDQGTANPTDDIDRMIIVVNDPGFTGDSATTGPWPYELPTGLTRQISVSVQSVYNDPDARFTHGLGHQFGLVDLYAHSNVVFAQPHVDTWDHMAFPFFGTGFMGWSKSRAQWMTGAAIDYIPRPAAGSPVNQTTGINFLSSTAANRKVIALGLTAGAATIGAEDVFYFIEARSNGAGSVDSTLPESGVLLYNINENVPQGEGPVRIIDDVLGTATLDDGALEIGDSKTTAEGLTITVLTGTAGADRDIQISYDPPATDNDVRITVGDPVWISPDIWVDSQKDGFDEDAGRTPLDRGDQAVEGEVNRLYVRVANPGPSSAFDFTIFVRISEPYHTVGGAADFNRFVGQLFVSELGVGAANEFVGYVEWIPDEDGNPHSCVEVEIPNVFNDVNTNNNRAQENLQEITSSSGSPYDQVTYPFGLTNDQANPQLYYFRVEGVPAGWTTTYSPRSALLLAGERVEGSLTVKPPDDAPACTNHPIRVSSWMPRGDTLLPVGGGTFQVDLRQRTLLELATGKRDCRRDPTVPGTVGEPGNRLAAVRAAGTAKACMEIAAQGCTNPPRPNQEIVLRYEHPSGYPVYRTVLTDAAGCYSDFLVVTEGGAWEVTAAYPGDDCRGGAVTPAVVVTVDLPTTGDNDGDGLPDPKEPQGDHDGDGLIGIYDTDSDNDGVPDGEEPEGNCDHDILPNVSDPDSDNDGTPDGRDLTPCAKGGSGKQRAGYSFHVGSTQPLGDLNRIADANIYAAVDVGYRLTDRLSLRGLLGFAQFTAESTAAIDHPHWLHVSANLEALFPAPSGSRLYVRGGTGFYRPKAGSADLGFNLGIGARIPLRGPFALELGTDLHHIIADDATMFGTFHFGVLFK